MAHKRISTRSYLNNTRLYDRLTAVYLIIWLSIIVFFRQNIPFAGFFFLSHLTGFILLLYLGIYSPQTHFLRLIRNWYPIIFLPLMFTALHYLVPSIHGTNLDPYLISADRLLTGTHPTVWMEKFSSPLLTDILQTVYSCYYFLPLLVVVPLYLQKKESEFERTVFILLTGFYTSYLCYLIFPALGPRFYLAHLHQHALEGGVFFERLSTSLNGLENIQWDAFPSGHVAIAILVVYFAFIHFTKLFYFISPIVLLLSFSTIYLRYHYVVDVLAGVLLAFLVIEIDRWYFVKRRP